jgi:dipeptide/tripeptide permease
MQLDRADYIFAGALITAISILFLAVSTYEIPFYSMEANVQFVSALLTAVGLVIIGYGYVAKNPLSR